MAEVGSAEVNGGEPCDVKSLLTGEGRDYLVRNNGDKVSISSLQGGIFALYFSASWCPPCRRFTPKLIEAYSQLSSKGSDFEVIFVSDDSDEDSFNSYFAEMPWLAIPFSDSDDVREQLKKVFKVNGIPHLVIIDANGKVLNEDGVQMAGYYGVDGYPFTLEKENELREAEAAAKRDQTLRSVLVSSSRDYVISHDETQVPVSDFEGKIVALYFAVSGYPPCDEFTPILAQIYEKLKEKGEKFEVVLVSFDDDKSSFVENFSSMPWFAIPFEGNSRERLVHYFDLQKLPFVVVIGTDGKTMDVDFADIVEEHGVEALEAFPFHQEKLDLLAEKAKAKLEAQTLESLLVSGDLDFVIGKEGIKVSISSLQGGIFALYFSGSWCPPCRRFTPKLIEAYSQLSSDGRDFEVIFVSHDRDEDSFNSYLAKMPWLAIPFSDSDDREQLKKVFKVNGIPHLVIIDANGKVLNEDGVDIVRDYGVDGYPFTLEKHNELREAEEAAKRDQTLRSVLVSPSRDYVISSDGTKVPVSDLEGKIVILYFAVSGYPPSVEFTPILAQIYEKLKEKGEEFEVVLVSLDNEESSFTETFNSMPWLFALPFEGNSRERLARYFELNKLPFVVVIGADGKTMEVDFADIVEEHGVEAFEAFPFHQEKLDLLAEKAKAKLEAQTLESLLVSGDLDFVIGKEDTKVPVKELVGKNILLYFSAHWCGPCRDFLPKLVEAYHEIKNKDDAFEIIFLSSDRDQSSFDEFYSGMPWLALPFGDERKKHLSRTFKIRGIPSLVAIDPSGRTVTKDVRQHLVVHGAAAYPFNEDRIAELEHQIEEMAKGWPEKIKHELHEKHELILVRCKGYGCDACNEMGANWSYRCKECDFDLHPKCALKERKDESVELVEGHEETNKDGCVCDGDVCHKL